MISNKYGMVMVSNEYAIVSNQYILYKGFIMTFCIFIRKSMNFCIHIGKFMTVCTHICKSMTLLINVGKSMDNTML